MNKIFLLLILSSCAQTVKKEPESRPLEYVKQDVIRAALMSKLPEFRNCLDFEMKRRNRTFEGLVTLIFVIGPDGKVKKAETTSKDSIPKEVLDCVSAEVRKIRFPEPMDGGTVEVKQPMAMYPNLLKK